MMPAKAASPERPMTRSHLSTLALATALSAALIGFALPSVAAPAPSINWKQQEPEILRHYRALVQLDTSSPPGNETRAVDYLKGMFDKEGIPVKTFAKDPNRANLVARIKGNGSRRPILLMSHTDVVGVQREKWPVDPFGAVQSEGYVWGRGTRDDKDNLTANLMVMLLAKRSSMVLDRDIIFLAESGEEADPAGVGIPFMVSQHFDEIDAEYALAEGGGAVLLDGRVTQMSIQTSEKVPRRFRLVATGTSGHGSVPRLDNPLTHLSAAVAKIGAFETPMRLNETTRAYFGKLAEIAPAEGAARYRQLLSAQPPASLQRYFAEREPQHYSMLRTSIVPTILKAGVGPNVIPSQAEATFDVRALPDEDIPRLFAEVTRLIGDEAVKVEPITTNLRPVSPPSGLDSDMYRALVAVSGEMFPGAAVLPTMMTGATDMAQLRAKGIQAYGIGPASTDSDTINYGAHSDVERLLESELYRFVEFTWRATTAVAAKK
jgi:acetylornithine deacetylase/succinyl-diaminopimelate desuccinylase-like protein